VTTPTEPNFYFFTGVRIIRGTHRVAVDEPVRVCREHNGELGVVLLGRQVHFKIDKFIGTWQELQRWS